MAREKKSDKDSGHSFEDYFKRAASPMLVLQLLNEEPMYVYQMTQELERRSFGVYTLSLLYPVIYRLVDQGYLEEGDKQISPDTACGNTIASPMLDESTCTPCSPVISSCTRRCWTSWTQEPI